MGRRASAACVVCVALLAALLQGGNTQMLPEVADPALTAAAVAANAPEMPAAAAAEAAATLNPAATSGAAAATSVIIPVPTSYADSTQVMPDPNPATAGAGVVQAAATCTRFAQQGGSCGASAGGVCCSNRQCCSKWGWCGVTSAHCDTAQGCQPAFGTCSGTPTPSPAPRASPSPPPRPLPSPSPPQPSTGFVRWDGAQFTLNGQKWVPVGFNAYWLGLSEGQTPPTKAQIEEMFAVAVKMDATVIRSHTLAVNFGCTNCLRPGTGSDPNVLNSAAWDAIDYAFEMARKYNIKLIVPLLDAYNYAHGGFGSFCQSRGISKDQFFTNAQVRSDFKNYITQWLSRVNPYNGIQRRNDPALFMIELGNELGNIRSEQQSNVLPTQEWYSDISRFIKTLDTNHLILSGSDECLGSPTSNDFAVPTLDAFSAHFYSSDGGAFSRMASGANGAAAVGKPYILGEYSSGFGMDFFSQVESMPKVKGSVFWHVYPHTNGLAGGAPVPHGDGFTLHYPEDSTQISRLQGHFRRMRGLDGGCSRCNFCKCDGNCNCMADPCAKCQTCKCDGNCNCIANPCDKCQFCKCDGNCNCIG